MDTPQELTVLQDRVAPLCAPMHQSVEKAFDIAHGHFVEHDMTDPVFARERTELTRSHSRRLLMTADLGPWRVGAGGTSGQLVLRDQLMTARILHVAPGMGVPASGRSAAKVSYYSNPPADLFGVDSSRLLLVWWIEPETGEAMIRTVRPTGPWSTGQPTRCDVDFMLPRTSEELRTMEFMPDDGDIQLELGEDEEGTSGDVVDGG